MELFGPATFIHLHHTSSASLPRGQFRSHRVTTRVTNEDLGVGRSFAAVVGQAGHHLHSARRGACQSAMLPALVTAAGGGWVTQMQSKYGATAKHAADIWAGDMSDTDSQVYKTIGYYWHAPQDVDSNRGLGCAAPLPTRN